MSEPLRVLLLADEPLIHTTLRVLLDATTDLVLVGATANMAKLPHLCRQTQPHLLLVGDGRMPLLHEVDLIVEQACPATQLVVLLNPHDRYPGSNMRLAGCCFKAEVNAALVHLLRASGAGAKWVSHGVAARLLTPATEQDVVYPQSKLTPVEQEVYHLLGQGWKNEQIAAHLHCTEQTVRNYSSHIYKKLGMNRLALIADYQRRQAGQN